MVLRVDPELLERLPARGRRAHAQRAPKKMTAPGRRLTACKAPRPPPRSARAARAPGRCSRILPPRGDDPLPRERHRPRLGADPPDCAAGGLPLRLHHDLPRDRVRGVVVPRLRRRGVVALASGAGCDPARGRVRAGLRRADPQGRVPARGRRLRVDRGDARAQLRRLRRRARDPARVRRADPPGRPRRRDSPWAIMAIAIAGIALALASLQVFVRDVEHVLMPLLMMLMYLTPILYPLTLVPESMRAWVAANPFTWLVGRLRDALLDGRIGFHWSDLVALAVALALFAAGRWMFRRLSPLLRGLPVTGHEPLLPACSGVGKDYAKVDSRGGRLSTCVAPAARARRDARLPRARRHRLRAPPRRIARSRRRERRRQVDAAQDHRRRGAAVARHRRGERARRPLLELGSGFHPEYTGRENIFLSAALMGRHARRADEQAGGIIAFADIGDAHRPADQALLVRHGGAARLRGRTRDQRPTC